MNRNKENNQVDNNMEENLNLEEESDIEFDKIWGTGDEDVVCTPKEFHEKMIATLDLMRKEDNDHNFRSNTFETNSSSTHCIALSNKIQYPKSYLNAIKGIFSPYYEGMQIQMDDVNIYETPESKLVWLLTATQHLDADDQKIIVDEIERILPNVNIDMGKGELYSIEDIEYLWDDVKPEYFTGSNLEKFLLEDVVIWGNRDLYDEVLGMSKIERIINAYSGIIVKYSG